jgi:hypothetical protein
MKNQQDSEPAPMVNWRVADSSPARGAQTVRTCGRTSHMTASRSCSTRRVMAAFRHLDGDPFEALEPVVGAEEACPECELGRCREQTVAVVGRLAAVLRHDAREQSVRHLRRRKIQHARAAALTAFASAAGRPRVAGPGGRCSLRPWFRDRITRIPSSSRAENSVHRSYLPVDRSYRP